MIEGVVARVFCAFSGDRRGGFRAVDDWSGS
jgi:hypothetical protein